MSKNKFSFRAIPSWAIMLFGFGFLYFTGLHTEAIGQVQRLMLSTGIIKSDIHEVNITAPAEAVVSTTSAKSAAPAAMAGSGFQMVDLNGKTVTMDSLKGKVIFMNIWATWCPPCIAEMPNIQSLYEKVDADKIAFVMLSVDEGSINKVKNFINKKGFTFPVYMPASQIPQEFSSSAIPTTFVISPAGEIVAKQEGMAEYDTPEVLKYLQDMAL